MPTPLAHLTNQLESKGRHKHMIKHRVGVLGLGFEGCGLGCWVLGWFSDVGLGCWVWGLGFGV